MFNSKKLIVLASVMLMGAYCYATEIQDVSCNTYAWNSWIGQSDSEVGTNTIGQTWTTGASVNNLSKITIPVMYSQGANVTVSTLGNLVCSVYSSVGGTLLGSASITHDSITTVAAWSDFVFSDIIPLASSTQYYFELSATGGYDSWDSDMDCYSEFHGPNAYSGGVMYSARSAPYDIDTCFQTYYDPEYVPEPATISMLLMGALCFARNRK